MGKIFHIKVTYEEYKNMQRDNIKVRLTQSSFGSISDVFKRRSRKLLHLNSPRHCQYNESFQTCSKL